MKVVHKRKQTRKMNKCRQTPNKNDGSKETDALGVCPTALLMMFLIVFNIDCYILRRKYIYLLSLYVGAPIMNMKNLLKFC